MKVMLFLRSLLFSTVMIIATVLYSFVCVICKPCSFNFRYKLIVAWTKFIIKSAEIICGLKYEVVGAENIPKGAAIVFSKHQSTWETFFLLSIFHQPAIILKKELLKIPFFGWGLSIIEPIAINRGKKRDAFQQILDQGKEKLKQGRVVLYFPEGTRTVFGAEEVKYKTGGARLAEATGAPVVPVAHNAGYFWPRRSFLKKPGTIKVVIGQPILTQDKPAQAIVEEAREWIEGQMKAF
ncbi:MAG: lysophospholipid acyltransferase family protein [Gammaproteobacteria bacterium]